MNYEINLLHHVGVVGKRVCAVAAETAAETAAHEGDDNTPSGPMGRGVKIRTICFFPHSSILSRLTSCLTKSTILKYNDRFPVTEVNNMLLN